MLSDPYRENLEKNMLILTGWICLNCLEISNKYRMDNIEKNGGLIFFNYDCKFIVIIDSAQIWS